MEVVISLVSSLIPLAVVGLIIWGIVSLARRGHGEIDAGIGTVRRLFIYGGALVGVFMAASGVSLLLGGLIDAIGPGDIVIGEEDTSLALGLSLTVVGAPVWWLFWRAGERSVRDHPVEGRSLLRRGYGNVVRVAGLAITMGTAVSVVRQLLQLDPFAGETWGWALTFGALWVLHDRWLARTPSTTRETLLLDRLYLFFGSVLGLAALSPAIGALLYEPLKRAYDSAFVESTVARASLSEPMREALVGVIVSAPVWYWHWLRQAIRDAGTTLWRTYLFIFGILSGVVTALVGTGILVYLVLAWALDATDDSAAEHFEPLAGAVSAIVVGLALWGYHRLVQRQRAVSDERSEPEQVYRYVMAAAGLVTLASGLVTVFVLGVEALTPNADVVHEDGWWREWLAAAITLLLMGIPLWGWYWLDVQRQVHRQPVAARLAVSRRVFVFAIAGVSVLVAAVDLVIVLFKVFEGLLESALTQDDIFDVRWSIALLLTTGAIGIYYWLVLVEDRHALAGVEREPEQPRAKTVLLVSPDADGSELVSRLEALGERVQRWRRLDAPSAAALSDEELAALHERVTSAAGEHVIVVVGGEGTPEVIPYQA
jgi:hypothetical protein